MDTADERERGSGNSGRTLDLAVKLLDRHGAEARSAVSHTQPTTMVATDYARKDTALWIDFLWSHRNSVTDEDAA